MRPAMSPNTVLAREIARGATVLDPACRDITVSVRRHLRDLPRDDPHRAMRAVSAALAEQHREAER